MKENKKVVRTNIKAGFLAAPVKVNINRNIKLALPGSIMMGG